jgi:Domain of unknown function (DUF4267)
VSGPEIGSRGSLRDGVSAREMDAAPVAQAMLTTDTRSVGIALLVLAIVPLGDMSIILGSGGSKSRAFSIHGVTCAAMLVVGLLLIHAI